MSIDMNSDIQAIWEFESYRVPVSTTNIPDFDWHNTQSINHAELYGLLRHSTRMSRCARVLVTVTDPVFVIFCNIEDRAIEVYSVPYFEYLQFMDLYIHIIDPEQGRVRWQVEGF